MRSALLVACAVVGVVATACEPGAVSQIAPTQQPDALPIQGAPPSELTLLGRTVVSGWDTTPVAGATVVINGSSAMTNARGEFTTTASFGTPIEVRAQGFLPRRTTLTPFVVTLWPAPTAADEQAIRAMAFFSRDRTYLDLYESVTVDTSFAGIAEPVAARAAWESEMNAMSRRLNLPFIFGAADYFSGFKVSFDELTAPCTSAAPTWGFCPTESGYPGIVVRPELARDIATIRRVLAFAVLRGHTQPGLLNLTHPAESLSLLEEQTLKMLRLRAPTVYWPDTDPQRQ